MGDVNFEQAKNEVTNAHCVTEILEAIKQRSIFFGLVVIVPGWVTQ